MSAYIQAPLEYRYLGTGGKYPFRAWHSRLECDQYADGQLDRLENSISGLSKIPERFHAYENEPSHSRGLRIIPVNHYCVLYIPDMKKAVVHDHSCHVRRTGY